MCVCVCVCVCVCYYFYAVYQRSGRQFIPSTGDVSLLVGWSKSEELWLREVFVSVVFSFLQERIC